MKIIHSLERRIGEKICTHCVCSLIPLLKSTTITAGHEAVIVKNGLRLCGTGGARATTAIQQNKAYWEVKLQQSGVWEVLITH